MIVINFFKLEHLVGELDAGAVVRIEGTIRAVASDTPGLHRENAAVNVRAVNHAAILSFMIPVGSINMLHGKPFGMDPDAPEKLDQRLQRAERAIAEYLADEGLTVRPGLIDIGEAQPVSGSWAGLAEALGNGGDHA